MINHRNLSSEEKRELLEQLLREDAARETASYPLSHGQQALWFLHRSAPESPAYNVALVVRVLSPVDASALRSVFQSLIERHPSLRTTFSQQDGQAVQLVHGHRDVCFEEIDASADSEDELRERITADYRRPFDLEQGPLCRVGLFTRAREDHVLLITMHHIVTDGRSTWMLISELLTLYEAQGNGRLPALFPSRWQYPDYVRWQTELLAGPEGERLWEYWREQLSGEPPVLDFPTDRPRPTVQSYNGASVYFTLPETLIEKLRALSQSTGATLYMILLAAFQVLLHRYTGQEDILVGSPTAGRGHSEFEDIFGYFVNPIVLRAELSGDASFVSFLAQVRQTVLDGLDHQDYPFPFLVERLQPARDAGRSPIFQVVFALKQSQGNDELSVLLAADDENLRVNESGLSLAPFKMAQQEGQFDLTLEMVEAEQSLSGVFQYNTDLFDVGTIERMAGHFECLLEGMVTQPEARISHLPLLSEAERQRILVEFNDTAMPYPASKCVHELFEEQAAKTPDAVAVVFPSTASGQDRDESVSYEELNARANRLAHRLRKLGVGPEVLVGLFVERSVEMVVGLLAILKAGGAYVPLDPEYPRERLAFMADDADLKVLLCHGATRERVPECAARILDVDGESATIAKECSDNPAQLAKPGSLVYVIYTSGSTGRPKGVCVEHRNVANLIAWHCQSFSLTSKDRCAQVASLSFDAAGWEIWPVLTKGAALHVVPSATMVSDARAMKDWICAHGVTVCFLPTPVAQVIVSDDWPSDGSLRLLLTGGDWFRTSIPSELPFAVINNYGPTENTVVATSGVIPPGISLPPIGSPIANARVYILDKTRQPVPIGVPGELYIGGKSVARGYLNRPDLTTERFLTDPFSDDSDARLYRTGDLCRWLPDGNIEYLGRIDTQVKIRGFRIECGEVENVLVAYPGIHEAVVDVRGEATDKQLVAWVVVTDAGADHAPPSRDELRLHLRAQLPDWMVPARFVFMDELPLTPNGKIDRRALPDPESGDIGSAVEYVAPRTDFEIRMAEIWSEVLGVDKVGLYDNFFDLGGHSLLAARLMAQVEEQFSEQLPLSVLFQGATVAELVSRIIPKAEVAEDIPDPWRPLVAIQPGGEKPAFFCLPGAGGNVLYFQELAGLLGEDQPFYGLQAIGLDGESEPYTRTEEMARHYVREIQTVQAHGPYLIGGHCLGSWVALEVTKQIQEQGEKVARLVVFDSTVPFQQSIGVDWSESEWIVNVTQLVGYLLGTELTLSEADIGRLDANSLLDHLHELLAQTGSPISKKQVAGLVRVSKTNCQMGYAPQDVPSMPITLFKARELHFVGRAGEELAAFSQPFKEEPTWGWGRYAAGAVDIRMVPGSHDNMLSSPNVQVLAESLRECLASTPG